MDFGKAWLLEDVSLPRAARKGMQRSPVEARAAEVPCSLRVSVQAPKASGLAQVTAEVRGVLNDAPWRQKRGGQG